MKTRKIDWRTTHDGKNSGEKEAYKNFIFSGFTPEKTEDLEDDPLKTSSSTFENEEKPVPETKTPAKKSRWLRLKDGDFNKEILIAIILALGGGYFVLLSNQNAQIVEISNLKKDVEVSVKKNDEATQRLVELDKNVQVFRAEVNKDIGYLQEKIRTVLGY